MNRLVFTGVVAALAVAVLPNAASAQRVFAKVNDVVVDRDGSVDVFLSVLNEFGETPSARDFDRVEVSFGGDANRYASDDGLEVTSFQDGEVGTDFVLILPAYEKFVQDSVIACAQGAGWFQTSVVVEGRDTSSVLFYGDGIMPHDGLASDIVPDFESGEGLSRSARPYMLDALEEAVRQLEESAPGRRRIIVLIGTGRDVQLTNATLVSMSTELATESDFSRAVNNAIFQQENILERYIDLVERVDARIYSVGYTNELEEYLAVMEVLARKTGGTYRRVRNIGGFVGVNGDGTNSVFGKLADEVNGELILEPVFVAEGGHDYQVSVKIQMPGGDDYQVIPEVDTAPFYFTVQPIETKVNLIPILIVVGIILLTALLLLVFLLWMSKKLKGGRDKVADRKRLEELVEKGAPYCQKCYRKQEDGWPECLYCKSNYPALEEKPQELVEAEEAQAKLHELDGLEDAEVNIGVAAVEAPPEAPGVVAFGPAGAAWGAQQQQPGAEQAAQQQQQLQQQQQQWRTFEQSQYQQQVQESQGPQAPTAAEYIRQHGAPPPGDKGKK